MPNLVKWPPERHASPSSAISTQVKENLMCISRLFSLLWPNVMRSAIRPYFDSLFERTQSSMVGKSRRQMCEAAGHMVPAVRKQSEAKAVVLSSFCLFSTQFQDSSPWVVHPVFMAIFPLRVKCLWKRSHNAQRHAPWVCLDLIKLTMKINYYIQALF